jgi:hypothetical protein
MGLHPNGAYPWPAPTVGDAKGLVEIEMAHISPKVGWATEPHLGIHIGPVHIHLAAVTMDDVTDFDNGRLKYTVGRGVGHHQRRQALTVLFCLGLQVGHIDIAVASQTTGTTFMPAMTALAGLVPWADWGIRQTLRW